MTDWRTLTDPELRAALVAAGEPKPSADMLVAYRGSWNVGDYIDRFLANNQPAVTVVPLTTGDPDGPIALEDA